MPNGGGKRPDQPKQSLQLKAALLLGALQTTGRRRLEEISENILGPDTPLSDESLLAEPTEGTRGSVLDIGAQAQSYTTHPEAVKGPMAGEEMLESPGMEFERQRERERQKQMQRTQQQFVGAGRPETSPQEQERSLAGRRGPSGATPPGGAPEQPYGISGRGMQLDSDRAADRAKSSATSGLKRQLAEHARAKFAADRRKNLQRIKNVLEGVDIGTSADVVSLIFLLLQMNVQMFNKYFFKSEFIPEQTLPEDAITVCLDISMCANPTSPPCCFFLAIIFIVAIIFQLKDTNSVIRAALGL